MRNIKYLLVIAGLTGLVTVGCGDAKDNTKPVGSANNADSSHQHTHEHGPMDGEVVDVASAGMKLECVAKYGQNLIEFYLYEDDGKTVKKIKCVQMAGRSSADKDKEYTITAVDPEKEGIANRFEIVDEDFAIARKTIGIKVEFEIDGTKHTVDIPKDPH